MQQPMNLTHVQGAWTRWRCLIALAMVSLLALAPVTGAQSLADTLEQVRPSVVSVGTLRPVKRVGTKSPPVRFMGTGFVVGSGEYVITNAHVLPADLDQENDEVLVVFSGRGKQAKPHKVVVVETDAVHDVALLRLQDHRLPALTLSTPGFIREGSEVAFTGFPLGMVLGLYPVTNKTIVSAITPFVMPALSSNLLTPAQIKRLNTPFEVYQLDAIAYPGNSGSPVYHSDSGEVIGIVNSVFVKESKEGVLAKPSAITYAIPVRYILELLRRAEG